MPDHSLRRKIEHQVAKSAHEHLIVFTDAKTTQIWQWVKREPGKPAACREHTYRHSQPGDALLQKLEAIAFSLEEEERLTLHRCDRRARGPDSTWSASPNVSMSGSSRSTRRS